jgi:hypothetical protein
LKTTNALDSNRVITNMQGKWKCTSHYYMPIYADYPLVKNPNFVIGKDMSIVFNDTFVNFDYTINKIVNPDYLTIYYNIKPDTNAYEVYIFTSTIPKSMNNNNPNYILVSEFLLYDNKLYYDADGIVYKFVKEK